MGGHKDEPAASVKVATRRGEAEGTQRWVPAAIGGLGLLLGVLELVRGVGFAPEWSPAPLVIVVHAVVGWLFVGSSVVALARRPRNRVGFLLAATGVLWYVPPGPGLVESPVAFSLGLVGDGLFWLPLVYLFLSFPLGRLSSRVDRVVVVSLLVYLPVGNVISILFLDPRTAGCLTCPPNVFMVRNDPSLATSLMTIDSLVGVVFGVLVLVRFFLRWRRAAALLRRALQPVLWAIGPAFLAAMYFIASSLVVPPRGFQEAVLPFVGLALAGLPVAFLVGLLRSRLGRSLVGELVVELQKPMPHGRLREALSRALGDPTLELAFWLPQPGRYVDDQGTHFRLPSEENEIRGVTELIDSDGEPLAVLIHDASLLKDVKRVEAVAGAARLTLENERLHAELWAQLDAVRASRARLVDAADHARRRLERDLHDGAQQRLLAASTAIERARMLNGDTYRSRLEDLLEEVSGELKETLTELRELARGIHPALLTDEGLGPAIESLARRAQLPTRILSIPRERFPTAVEAAAYFVVAESLTNAAKHAGASEVVVRFQTGDGSLRIQISDDGVGGADIDRGSGLRGLEDRVVSLGGVFDMDSPDGDGTTITATIPLEPGATGSGHQP
ncbi:MAG: histidine kinase [Acidimicrobiia bacterium]